MIELLYYFLPAYVANMTPPLLAKYFPKWDAPVDGGLKWRGKRLLGRNKTWRGLIGGMLVAGIVFLMQKIVLPLPEIQYPLLPPFYGVLMGFGALFVGDCGMSFVKRQLGYKSGESLFVIDQVDFTIGVLLVTVGFLWPGWDGVLLLLVVNGIGSAVIHYAGWKVGILKQPF